MNTGNADLESTLLGELDVWLNKFSSNGAIPVITGMNGDMDTVGSAIALASSHSNMMACGLHLGRVAKKVCEELSAPFRKIASRRKCQKLTGKYRRAQNMIPGDFIKQDITDVCVQKNVKSEAF